MENEVSLSLDLCSVAWTQTLVLWKCWGVQTQWWVLDVSTIVWRLWHWEHWSFWPIYWWLSDKGWPWELFRTSRVLPKFPFSTLLCFSWKGRCMGGQRGPRGGLAAGLQDTAMSCSGHLCSQELSSVISQLSGWGGMYHCSLLQVQSALKVLLDVWKGSN